VVSRHGQPSKGSATDKQHRKGGRSALEREHSKVRHAWSRGWDAYHPHSLDTFSPARFVARGPDVDLEISSAMPQKRERAFCTSKRLPFDPPLRPSSSLTAAEFSRLWCRVPFTLRLPPSVSTVLTVSSTSLSRSLTSVTRIEKAKGRAFLMAKHRFSGGGFSFP